MNSPDPLRISVITPSFNQGQFLGDTIESVLRQKYPNLEYIIIDGQSKDNSVEVIKAFAKHLHYWVSEPDSGQTDAINKGLRLATGDVVTWLNSDDLYVDGALAEINRAFAKYPEDVIYGDYSLITQRGRKFLTRYEVPFDFNMLLYGVNFIGQPSAFFRRSVLDRFGYLDPTYHYAMDHEFWIRVARGGGKFRHIKRTLSQYRYHPDSKTVSAKPKVESEMSVIRAQYGFPIRPSWEAVRGYWYRIKRQLIKLVYRGRIDVLGGNLNRIWFRIVQRFEDKSSARK